MPWHLFLLHQQLHPQLNLLMLSDLLAPLPSRMVGLTPQSPQSPVVHPPYPPLPLHPHKLRSYHLPLLRLRSQSLISGASQSCSKALLNPYLPLPLKRLRPPHVPPLYRHKPARVRHTRLLSRRVPCARAKTVILPPLGPPSTRVPWQMAKIVASVSVGGRKLVLAVPVLVLRLRLCLVRDWHRTPIRLLVAHPLVYPLQPCGIRRTTCVLLHLFDDVNF